MGRPLRCVPNFNPFLNYTTTSTTLSPPTTTLQPENLNQYIFLPISGLSCPEKTFPLVTTTTTQPPLVINNNIDNCNLFNVNLFLETNGCYRLQQSVQSGSAVVRYQPCGSNNLVNQIIYQSKDFCAVGNNIRLLSGNANIQQISICQKSLPCDIIITEIICDLQIKDITCDIIIEIISIF